MRISGWVVLVLLAAGFGRERRACLAGEVPQAAAPARVAPELAPDPEVMKLIDSLGENSSCLLPPVKTLGDWNDVTKKFNMQKTGPGGRDYTSKAVWMPDRKRAFFCGANHGAPHRLNDAWEHDLPANTWVMLFAPDPNNVIGVMEIKDFEVRDKDGKVVEKVKYVQTKRDGPTHYGHTWWGLTYDPEMKAALWMNLAIANNAVPGPNAAGYVEKTTGSKEGIYRGPPLWAFYPHEKRWAPVLTPRPWPVTHFAGALEYVPDLHMSLWMHGKSGTWGYSAKS